MVQDLDAEQQARDSEAMTFWAVFGPDGSLEAADARFLEATGPLRAGPSLAAPGTFWAAQGFVPEEGRPGLLQKEGRRYRVGIRAVGNRLLVRLEEVTATLAAERWRRKFLSVAAHDLRGPLSNVRSYASLLLSPRVSLDERVRKGLEVMGRNADRALHLTQALFELWKADLGPLDLEAEREALEPLLEEAEALARAQAAPLQVQVQAEVLPLPELCCDREKLRVVLHAFWAHALGRSSPGGVLRFRAEDTARGVVFSFFDTGPTLSATELEHAFDRDFVVAHARKLDAGFELCLGAVFVQAHGGTLGARQDEGGATFSFTIPKDLPLPAVAPGGRSLPLA